MNRKEEQWRNEGAAYALRTAKAKGIDGLEADLRCRGICGISVVVPEERLLRACIWFYCTDYQIPLEHWLYGHYTKTMDGEGNA